MKSLTPWFCLAALTSVSIQMAFANQGLDAYREGNYSQAVDSLISLSGKDPIADYYLGRMRLYGYGQLKNNTLAIRHFKLSAEKGYLPSQNMMARYSLLIENNPEEALYWFKKAAQGNDVNAQMYSAAAYLFGVGVKKNPDQARAFYIAAAKNGNSIAQFTLAEHFLESRQAANKKMGLIWLNKAVEQGNADAQVKLGEVYAQGTLVKQDFDKANELIGLAVKQGYLPAIYQMGQIARLQKNLPLAKDWYSKAAEQKYAPAQLALASLYLDPKGSFFDAKSGFLMMLEAAQNNSVEAQKALSAMYKKGEHTELNEHLAKEWEAKAALTNKETPKTAQINAALWLSNNKEKTFAKSDYGLNGIFTAWYNTEALKENSYNQPPQMDVVGRNELYKPQFTLVEPNEIAISEYYDALATSLGDMHAEKIAFPRYTVDEEYAGLVDDSQVENSPSSSILSRDNSESVSSPDPTAHASSYLSGDDIKPQAKSRAEQLRNKAILGVHTAQFTLGQLYQEGNGVEKNIQEAIRLYELAAAQKDLRAEYTLGILYLEGKEVEPDHKKALDWLNEAAFKGNAYAQFALGELNENGYKDSNGNVVIAADPEQSMGMYFLSAGNNYGPAQYRLAEFLVRDKNADKSAAAQASRNKLIKQLYEGALKEGVEQAALPLAFFNAMDVDKTKQVQAFEVAQKQASKGNGQAALLLALMYDRGITVEASQSEALHWYQQATLNPISEFILGTYYSQGSIVNKDLNKGKEMLKKSAQAGFSYANLNLAVINQNEGSEFLPELNTALKLGNSKAGLLLADYYLSLAADEAQMIQARDIYQHFAAKGDKVGQVKLGYMFEKGLGGQADAVNAEKWYTLAAEQGQPMAQYLLGRIYQLGSVDKTPDYTQAIKWYGNAQSTYTPAAVAYGFVHDTVDNNYQKAKASYELAAQYNDPVGQFNLALIYEKGKGEAVDFNRAKKLYTEAANKGHVQSMVQLAGLYFNGQGGARDEQQALHLLKNAANAGDKDALYQLGLLLETGVATKIDLSKALNYYQASSDKGNAKATLALARMYQYGLGVPKDSLMAEKYYKMLAAQNNSYAQYQLATFNFEGLLGKPNPVEGKRLLIQAQENGSLQARKALQWLDSQSKEQLSFIEPASINISPRLSDQPVELMYLDALNEWNRGDEILSRMILDRIKLQFPHYMPARRAYDQLQQQSVNRFLG